MSVVYTAGSPSGLSRNDSNHRVRLAMVAAFLFLSAIGLTGAVQAIEPQVASLEADLLLGRLQMSTRPDLLEMPGLAGAEVLEGVPVHSYPDREPLYYLHPISEAGGEVMGIIAVDARTGNWSWYTFGYRGASFPPVNSEEANILAVTHADACGASPVWREPIVVAMPDKHLYWLIEGNIDGNPCETLVGLDDAAAPVRSSIDGGLAAILEPQEASPIADKELLDRFPPAGPAPRLPRPDVCLIPDVPFHFQETSYYCQSASLQMIWDRWGEEIVQTDIAHVYNPGPSYGSYLSDAYRTCHFSGMSVAIQDSSLQGFNERKLGYMGSLKKIFDDPYNHLKNLVYQGYPVHTLNCYDPTCDAGHWRVTVGYDDGLNEFIVHDPWYNSPYWGPYVHFNQQVFVDDLMIGWNPDCYILVTGPWEFDISLPPEVAPGDTFIVSTDILYPGPAPFNGFWQVFECSATIHLPTGFSLASGSTTVPLSDMLTGDIAHVDWEVIAGMTPGEEVIGFQAQGEIQNASSWSYASYSDSIGGHARAEILVGDGSLAGWESEERLTNDPATSCTTVPHARSMYVEPGGAVHVVWAETRDGNSEIYYRKWDSSWGPEVRLTNDAGFSAHPAIAGTSGDDLHVVWMDSRPGNYDIYYTKWNGVSWSSDLALTSETRPDQDPAIAVDGLGHVHVMWVSSRGFSYRNKIFYREWDGASWSAEAEVGSETGRDTFAPSVTADQLGRVHLVYEQNTVSRGPEDIFYRMYDGVSWSSPEALTLDPAYAHCPVVTLGPDTVVHVVWHDGRHLAGDIYYRRFISGSWEPEVHVVDYEGDSQNASIAAEANGNLHLVWEDYRNGEGEIYYKNWDGSWSSDERLTCARYGSSLPCAGVDANGNAHVVWTDDRDGNCEIYYRKRTGVAASVEEGTVPGDWRQIGLALTVSPAPAEHSTSLEFTLPVAGETLLRVFDVNGRCVRTLARQSLPAGRHVRHWDGRDDSGREVASGVYFCRLEAAGKHETRSAVLIMP